MAYNIKEKFADRFDHPDKCLEKLRKAYNDHVQNIISGTIWKDEGKIFFTGDRKISDWAAEEDPQLLQQIQQQHQQAVNQNSTMSPAPVMSSSVPQMSSPSFGFVAAIVAILAIGIISLTILASDNMITAKTAIYAIVGLIIAFLVLMLLPPILSRLAEMAPFQRLSQRERPLRRLFDDAHEEFRDALIAIKNTDVFDRKNLLEDPASQFKVDTVSVLLTIYAQIFQRSETVWQRRIVLNRAEALRAASDAGAGTSDVG